MRRGGFALVVTILLFVALAGLAASVLALGAREAIIASSAERLVLAQRRAEEAVRQAVAGWSTRDFAGMAPGERIPLGTADTASELTVQRLDGGLYLVRAAARIGPTGHVARGRAAVLVRALDPAELAAAFPAAVTVTEAATLERGGIDVLTGCGAAPAAGIIGPIVAWDPGVTVGGDPPVAGGPPGIPVASPLAPPLLGALPHLDAGPGEVAPAPVATGDACVLTPDNWGAFSPGSPCHGLLPLVAGRGPLVIRSGEGRGVLLVDGDLLLGGSFRFAGLLAVDGTLELEEGVEIRGAVRARRFTLAGGHVAFDPCERGAAAAAPAFDGPFRLPGRLWIPVW